VRDVRPELTLAQQAVGCPFVLRPAGVDLMTAFMPFSRDQALLLQ
jgi:hypothetical protein